MTVDRISFGRLVGMALATCRVPDDWLIGSRRGLLLAREVLLELKRCI